MKSWSLSRAAKAALIDIYSHTLEQWGQAQADRYLNGIFETFDRIAAQQELWRPIPPELEVDGYFARYERHYIYWRELSAEDIGFATILHVSMLQGDRLRDAFSVDAESDG